MITASARGFRKSIAVVSVTYSRTYHMDGSEAEGAHADALWVAHLGEFHYYGVVRASETSNPTCPATRGTSFDVRKRQDNACAGRAKRRLIRIPVGSAMKEIAVMPLRKGKRRQHGGEDTSKPPESVEAELPDEKDDGTAPPYASIPYCSQRQRSPGWYKNGCRPSRGHVPRKQRGLSSWAICHMEEKELGGWVKLQRNLRLVDQLVLKHCFHRVSGDRLVIGRP